MDPVELLRRAVAIPSTPGSARESDVAHLFRQEAEAIGWECRLVEPKRGKGSLVVSLDGSLEERILLLAHLDVAPAEALEWRVPPFSGELQEGAVWGRGSVDAKGLAVVWLAAMRAVQAQQRPLRRRGIALILAADEESGGRDGMESLLSREPSLAQGTVAFGEGGGYRFRWQGRAFVTVQIGECGRFRLRTQRAVVKPWQGKEAFWSLATESLVRSVIPKALDNTARLEVMRRKAFPLDVEASLFCRMRPAEDGVCVLTYPPSCEGERALRAFCAENAIPRAELAVESHEPPTESAFAGDFFEAIRSVVVECFPRATLLPVITRGSTDSRFLRRRGVSTYGFFPFVRLETARRQHRPNERLPLDELGAAIQGATQLLKRLCF